MIERMYTVTVVATEKNRDGLLSALREAGLMHISGLVRRGERIESIGKDIASLSSTLSQIMEAKRKKKSYEQKELSSEEFERTHSKLVSLFSERNEAEARIRKLSTDIGKYSPWGLFDPEEVRRLASDGVRLYFYTLGKKELSLLEASDSFRFIRLADVSKMAAVAVIDRPLDSSIQASLLELPEMSVSQMQSEINFLAGRLGEIDSIFEEANCYESAYRLRIRELEQDEMYEKVSATALDTDGVSLLQGYVPDERIEDFRKVAKDNCWAYLIDDPTEEEAPPTLLKHKGIVRIIQPIYDILGTVPGYRERDISSWFLCYFAVFFAMIIGDAGYGLIFLLVAALLHRKLCKATELVLLCYVMGACTVIWGAMTGTWFGSYWIIEHIPPFRLLMVDCISNFPELTGNAEITSTYTQNMVMKWSFMLGTSHLSVACVLNVIDKVRKKDLSLFADIGWLIDILVLYMLVLNLVIGESMNASLVFGGVAIGFALVCLFAAQGPGVPFVKGMLASLGGFFTTFLNTISCFSNIMSYIRLFAVGMASLAIAQSFNAMGGGMKGLALPLGILVIILGHTLNLVMGLLSVVVHGVRLNLMEFSNQLGMEWSGYNYDPFRVTVTKNSKN